jgi:hypothetical protein
VSNSLPPGWGGQFNDEWLRAMQQALRPFAEYQKAIARSLAPLQQAMAAISRQLRQTTAGISQTMLPLVERLERYPGICIEFGWPPFDVPVSVVLGVVDLYDEKGPQARAEVDALFIRLVPKKTLLHLRDEWQDCHLLRRRFQILDAIMRGHIRREYALTVPALLASVEGVIADLHVPKGRMTQKDYQRYLSETFAGPEKPQRWADQLNDAARSVIVDAMVGNFTHGDPAPHDVRRNAVLHGADVAYDNEAYSLKALLMLDLVREQYGYVALADSPIYHRQSCSTLRRSAKLGRHYKTTTSAGRAGKRPCGVCRPDTKAN